MAKRVLKAAVVLLSCFLAACSTKRQVRPDSEYVPALDPRTKVKYTKLVPLALPGQMMPIKTKSNPKLVGEAAAEAAHKKALKTATSGEYINAITNYDYVPGVLYQIYAAPLRVTDIQFQENEHIIAVGAGDTSRWQVSKTYSGIGAERCEHLLVKPSEDDMENSLVVTTDMRTYHLILKATPSTYMASVTWRYPDENGVITEVEELEDGTSEGRDATSSIDVNQMNFGYKVKLLRGKMPDWYPKMVFHDGKKTYIRFAPDVQELPNLYVVKSDKLQIVNYRVQGDCFVVDRVLTEAQLRTGAGKRELVSVQILMQK